MFLNPANPPSIGMGCRSEHMLFPEKEVGVQGSGFRKQVIIKY
jgi:hypothetical protein